MTPTILCVDDDPGITRLMQESFSSRGFAVLTASSAFEALEIIHKIEVDLVVLDLMLPDVDGFGFCELLAAEPQNHEVPVIVVSGCASDDARMLALQHGVTAFLSKPFRMADLIALAKRIIVNQRLRPLQAAV